MMTQIVVLAIGFMTFVGLSIVVRELPHFARVFDATPFEITLIFAISAIASAVAQPFWGRISDRVGRKWVMAISLVAAAIAVAWTGLASSLGEIYAARVLAGLAGGLIPALFATIADVTSEEKRTAAIGGLTAAFSAGFIMGPVIGGFLTEGLSAEPNFGLPFFASGGVFLVLGLLTIVILPDTRPARSGAGPTADKAGFFERMRRHRDVRFVVPALAGAAVQFGSAGTSAVFALWALEKFGWGVTQIAWVLTYMSVLVTFMHGFGAGWLSRKIGDERALAAAMFGIVIAFAVIAALDSPLQLYLVLVVAAFGHGIGRTVSISLVSIYAKPENRGETLGLANGLTAIAAAGGPLLAGWLFGIAGLNAPFVMVACVATVVFLVVFIVLRPKSTSDA
ncbi:MAG TPA: MFS transporter [Sneathiellales bacterium]|nr:MFS transporter [Sneathiellales bacterium]